MTINYLKKTVSSILAAAIVLCAPGLLPYQALAATFETGPVRLVPETTPVAGANSPILKTPEIPATGQIPGLTLPGAAVVPGAVTPEAEPASPSIQPSGPAITPAANPEAPSTLANTEKLAAVVAPAEGTANPAQQETALEQTYTGAATNAGSAAIAQESEQACSGGGCPFAKLFGKSSKTGNGGSGANTPAPARPKPADVGLLHKAAMYAMAYTWWIWDRAINAKWDKMPPTIAAVYLYFNEQYLRLHMWDAAANAPSTENKTFGAATENEKKFRTANGTYFDLKDPGMSAADTRFNHLRKPEGMPNPDWAKMEPNPYVISQKLQQRDHDAQGNPIIKEIPANSWFTQIQPQLHDWFNHEQEPLENHPVTFTVPVGHPLKPEGGEVTMNRTKTDPSVPTAYQGAAIHRNGETSPWDRSDLYGSSQETQDAVRSHQGGHLKLGEDGWLPDDPAKPGVPKTGFNNNVSMTLTMNNVTMAKEHNLVADAISHEYKARGVQLSDEELFQKARLRMTGFNARNHTVPWTQWLFAGSKIGQEIMWADWYGFVNKRFKLGYMRWTDRHPFLAKFTDPFIRTELIFGVPGTNTTHYGKHYNFTEEFVDVYRMHQLIRDTYKVHHLETNPDGTVEISVIDTVKLRDMVGTKTQEAMRKHSYSDWALTMGKENVGELTINNVPDDLRNVTAQDGVKDGHKVDLGAIDIMRTRERLAASTYVKFTMRLGEKPPRTFEELTGGDKEKADRLRAVYKSINDVDFQIGILAERKPLGYALGNRQFKVFVLSAPARLKNDRFLSSEYNAKTYDQSGIDYMETNNWGNLVARHAPELKALDIEAMANPYMTYPEPGWLPKALTQDSLDASNQLDKSIKRGAGLAGAIAIGTVLAPAVTASSLSAAVQTGIVALGLTALPALGITAFGGLAFLGLDRIKSAGTAMSQASTSADADKAVAEATRGAKISRAAAVGLVATSLAFAYLLTVVSPVIAVGAALAAGWAGLSIWKKAGFAAERVRLQRSELRTLLGEKSADTTDWSLGATNSKLFGPTGVNQAEFERIYRDFGALRGYVTAYDLARLREANDVRAASEGRGWLSRLKGRLADKARDEKLMDLYADRVVWEDGLPGGRVPAISQERLLEVFQGSVSKDAVTVNARLAADTRKASDSLLKKSLINAAVGLVGAVVLAMTAPATAPVTIALLAALPLFSALAAMVVRWGALAELQHAGNQGATTPGRFTALFSGEKEAKRGAWLTRIGALTTMDLGGMMALRLMHVSPVAAAVLGAAVLTGWAVWRGAKAFANSAYLERAGIYGVLKENEPQTPIDQLPGATALEKHGRYFSGGKEVAKFWTTYHYVRLTGLSVFKSLTTAASWHLFFSGKTQKNMTAEEKAEFHPGKFDNYIPNFADAQGPTNTRIFAMGDVPGGPKRGDVDMVEFDRIFNNFAPGGDYVTMKNLKALWWANAQRDWAKTNWASRFMGKIAFNKRFNQLMVILADRVVTEDGKQVPAISRAGLLRYYQGGAPYDLVRERSGR